MFWQKIYHLPFPLSGEISVEEEDTEIEWEVWENIWKRTGIYILTICNTIRPQVFAPVRGNFLSFPLNEHLESESGWNPCSV